MFKSQISDPIVTKGYVGNTSRDRIPPEFISQGSGFWSELQGLTFSCIQLYRCANIRLPVTQPSVFQVTTVAPSMFGTGRPTASCRRSILVKRAVFLSRSTSSTTPTPPRATWAVLCNQTSSDSTKLRLVSQASRFFIPLRFQCLFILIWFCFFRKVNGLQRMWSMFPSRRWRDGNCQRCLVPVCLACYLCVWFVFLTSYLSDWPVCCYRSDHRHPDLIGRPFPVLK